MKQLTRIAVDPEVMGGKPCIRGLRVTVGAIVGLMASGHSTADILKAYPYLEQEDLQEALTYAAWRVEDYCSPQEINSDRAFGPSRNRVFRKNPVS